MAKRKKTPDIMGDLLGGEPGTPKPEPGDSREDSGAKPAGKSPRKKEKPPGKKSKKKSQKSAGKPAPVQRVAEQITEKEAFPGRMAPEEAVPEKTAAEKVTIERTVPVELSTEKIIAEQPERTLAGPVLVAEESTAHFVAFRMGRQLYALPLEYVELALRMVAITPLPEAPSWVVGVINVHGRVISAVDLRQRLGEQSREPHPDDFLLLIRGPEQDIALIVDEVTEVLEVSALQVEPPLGTLSRSRPLAAVIRREEGLILILDVARLVPSESA